MEDLISIIVPIYNVEKFLPRCIESIINQTYKNIEIILVNDGSTDDCLKICKDYSNKDKRIVIIDKKNGGLSDARNAGLEIAKGKYVSFVDSDDFISEKMILELYKILKKTDSQISICNRYMFFENKKHNQYKISFKQNNEEFICLPKKDAIKELCTFNLFDMSAWGKLYEINLFSDIKFPKDKLSEDYYIMYKLFDKCDTITYIDEPYYVYCQRKGSISKNKNINYDYRQASYEQMIFIEDKYPELKKYVRTAYALSNMTIFDWYIKNRGTIPEKGEIRELQNNVRQNMKYILENDNISKLRKIQTKIFIKNSIIYNFIFRVYNIIR